MHVLREVTALARSADPERASWQRAKQAILDAATHIRLEASETSPPIRLRPILELCCIQEGPDFSVSRGPNALLIPRQGGFIVRVRAGLHNHRRRFATAHEVGHTFFYDATNIRPTPLISQTSNVYSRKEEGICSAFASELLLPRELLLKETAQLRGRRSLEFILGLAKHYDVSPEVAVRRLICDLGSLETTVAIVKESRLSTRDKGPSLRRYRGRALKGYLRKPETAALRDALAIVAGGPPYDALDELPHRHAVVESIAWHPSATGSSFAALLNFAR